MLIQHIKGYPDTSIFIKNKGVLPLTRTVRHPVETDVKFQIGQCNTYRGYLKTDVKFQIWPYDTYKGYLETDVKFQIWPHNTYRGYIETDVKFQIWPYDTDRGYLETDAEFKIWPSNSERQRLQPYKFKKIKARKSNLIDHYYQFIPLLPVALKQYRRRSIMWVFHLVWIIISKAYNGR